jgi:hypothetical protein
LLWVAKVAVLAGLVIDLQLGIRPDGRAYHLSLSFPADQITAILASTSTTAA